MTDPSDSDWEMFDSAVVQLNQDEDGEPWFLRADVTRGHGRPIYSIWIDRVKD